jgi:uncharacterized protein YcgL (UPF0745 family)
MAKMNTKNERSKMLRVDRQKISDAVRENGFFLTSDLFLKIV